MCSQLIAGPSSIRRRQRYSRFGATPLRRATTEMLDLSSSVSSTIRSFSEDDQRRLRPPSVVNELKNRGLQDILIAVVDGLKGFPEAITVAFPEAMVQTCIVHPVRRSLNFCSWKDRKAVAADLRRIHGPQRPNLMISRRNGRRNTRQSPPAWRRARAEVIPFFAFDPAIGKIIYATNANESLNRVIRKSIKTRSAFPIDEAATKLIYLVISSFEKDGRNVRGWFAARNQFAMMFRERFDA